MKHILSTALVFCAALSISCSGNKQAEISASGLERAKFQTVVDGKPTDLYILKNANGMEVCLSNYGARIVSIWVPDRQGEMKDVVLGFDSIGAYLAARNNMGSAIGRYAGRIAHGKATIDGVEYNFPINNNGHSMHSGSDGFHTRIFNAEQKSPSQVAFSYRAVDGECGYPGNFDVTVTYTLTDDNAVDILYEGTTDKTTIVNMTNHSFFNLDGDPNRLNTEYVVWIDADRFAPIDSTCLTTGELLPVENTPMDFRTPTAIGVRIGDDFDQLRYGGGYDQTWALNTPGDINHRQAVMYSPHSGIIMEVYTTEPALQFYAGGSLNGTVTGKKGIVYNRYCAVCLESQKFPDSANKPQWPSSVLKPGEKFTSRCIYKFSVKE